MMESNTSEIRRKIKRMNLRTLRISLKYRPEILKLILKMRQCIQKKNVIIKNLKSELKQKKCTRNPVDAEIASKQEAMAEHNKTNVNNQSIEKHLLPDNEGLKNTKDSSSQTEKKLKIEESMKIINESNINKKKVDEPEREGWDIHNHNGEKTIAEQVKEVAQSALQQTGMVYVESAGMYYDYKTGYYYNSELGLYYHTDTGCYYYYSDEKQSFVFHSYPDRSAENPGLAAHEKKKAKKHKKEQRKQDDIDDLTKNLSQGEEDGESSKPKRRKRNKKVTKKTKPDASNATKDKDSPTEKPSVEITTDKIDETPCEEKEQKHDAEEKEINKMEKEMEDGECSETESEMSTDEDSKSVDTTSTATDDESIAKHHPPCMRIIVRETNMAKLKVGNLFLITKDGGTIGREGEQHSIIIRDHNVSRNHLEIKYNTERKTYFATDLGSKNGTILNGLRMSESQDVSMPTEVMHGSTIQLGETKLLCHIHPGNDTCGHCEPGLIMETQEQMKAAYTRTCSVQKQHQLELARLKNKYAPKPLMIEATAYKDRAQLRRNDVGSSHHAEKTQSANLETFIPAENKGFKLLEKMGWSKGEGLGKDSQGDTEPVPLVSNEGTSGLGSSAENPSIIPMTRLTSTLGPATLRLAAKTKMLSKPAKAFQDMDEEEFE